MQIRLPQLLVLCVSCWQNPGFRKTIANPVEIACFATKTALIHARSNTSGMQRDSHKMVELPEIIRALPNIA
jgi:hypothetical protein